MPRRSGSSRPIPAAVALFGDAAQAAASAAPFVELFDAGERRRSQALLAARPRHRPRPTTSRAQLADGRRATLLVSASLFRQDERGASARAASSPRRGGAGARCRTATPKLAAS